MRLELLDKFQVAHLGWLTEIQDFGGCVDTLNVDAHQFVVTTGYAFDEREKPTGILVGLQLFVQLMSLNLLIER